MENFSSRNMLVVLREGYWGTVKSSLQSMKVVLDIPILSYWEIFIGEPMEMLLLNTSPKGSRIWNMNA